jgi:acyl-CoA synthetase (AMP-forming)/AMP-acid ligase II
VLLVNEAVTLDGAFLGAAHRFGDTVVHYDGNPPVRTTLHEIHRSALRVAGGLIKLGVNPGDRVAVQLSNRVEAAIAYQGALLAGAVLVPIVHTYGHREVGFILRESGARALVLADRRRAVDYTERIVVLRAVTDQLEHIVLVGPVEAGTVAWEELASSEPVPLPEGRDPDDVCLLAYTSGTTADPKGVQHTHRTVLAELATQPALVGGSPSDIQLASFPVGHIAGLLGLLRALILGTPTVVMDGWHAARATRLVAEQAVTFTSGSPFHLTALLEEAEAGASLGSLREFLVGAATVPPELVARAARAGIAAFRCYGSTEHPTISCGRADDPLPKRQFTDGRLAPGTEVRIVDPAGPPGGPELPAGVDGEVLCRGPERFIGYRNGLLDSEVLLADGWMRTGDIGHLDTDGFLTITDRAKDVIIRAGETISSREVEEILSTCPGVGDAAAVAVPDARYGERVGAVVVCAAGAGLDLHQVRAHFEAVGAARHKSPELLYLVTELPRTALGKVRKAELRALLAAPASLTPSK